MDSVIFWNLLVSFRKKLFSISMLSPNIWIWFKFIGWFRGFIADYGVPLMVLVWTAVSYIPVNDVPRGIPRRLFSPNPWSPGAYSNWTVIKVNIVVCQISTNSLICLSSICFWIAKFLFPCIWSLATNSCLFSCAGHVECSSIIYSRSIYTSNYDCCTLLLRSQCCISTCPTEGVQSEETSFLSLWPPSFGFLGKLLPLNNKISLAIMSKVSISDWLKTFILSYI